MPLMIGPSGNPGIYEPLKSCGPVLVTVLNSEGGKLKDASFALFDPSWIAYQPAFLFAGEEQAAGKGKKKEIDF